MSTAIKSKLAFLFPGQGSFTNSTLAELHLEFPQLHGQFEIARAIIQKHFGKDLAIYLSPEPQTDEYESIDNDFEISQCTIFLASYFTFKLCREQGMIPDVLVGHSIGEMAALTAAEVFNFETGLRLVCQRTLAVRDLLQKGKMVAASCEPRRMEGLLTYLGDPHLAMGVINGPKQVVISGPPESIEKLFAVAHPLGLALHSLKAQYAFHSMAAFRCISSFIANARSELRWEAPKTPVYSPIAQRFYGPNDDFLDHLGLHLIERVDFATAVQNLYSQGIRHFVEMGDRSALTNLVRLNLFASQDFTAVECHPRTSNFKNGIERASREVQATPTRIPERVATQKVSHVPVVEAPPVVKQSARSELAPRVVAIFKELTNYPEEVLELDANLESDLGLDSIKQIEIMSRISAEFAFPMPQNLDLGSVNTIGKVILFLSTQVGGAPAAAAPTLSPDPIPAPAPTPIPARVPTPPPTVELDESVRAQVLQIFRELTNYPEEVLELDANLESDLGLDSIKQIEILSKVCAHLGIPMRQDMNLGEVNTIRKLILELQGEEATEKIPSAA